MAFSFNQFRDTTMAAARHGTLRGCHCAILILGIHSSQEGRYQFQSPRSFMPAGSRIERITVASMRTATPSPRPNCFMPMSRMKAKMENTATMIAAALVITPAVALHAVCRLVRGAVTDNNATPENLLGRQEIYPLPVLERLGQLWRAGWDSNP